MNKIQILELIENQSSELSSDSLSEESALAIWQNYGDKFDIEPPSFKNGHKWFLTPSGWVGNIPINDSLHICIRPKVGLANLFRMLEYAYQLNFAIDTNLVNSSSLEDFYERLANILALKIRRRTQKGLYKEYIHAAENLPYVRGKLNLKRLFINSLEPTLPCQYQENTADICENQIITWTLFCIARTGICGDTVQRLMRKTFRDLQSIITLKPFLSRDCHNRTYNRLNSDYQTIHALCRFFLDSIGPAYGSGTKKMIPFIVDMDRLFELFVAEWLKRNLSEGVIVKIQSPFKIGTQHQIEFRTDILLEDQINGEPLCVLDTKYKTPPSPSTSDLQQVIAYAKAWGSKNAILIYPHELEKPFYDIIGGEITVRTASFLLDKDLDESGWALMESISNSFTSKHNKEPVK